MAVSPYGVSPLCFVLGVFLEDADFLCSCQNSFSTLLI